MSAAYPDAHVLESSGPDTAPIGARSILLGECRDDLRFKVRAQHVTPYAGVELHDIEYVLPQVTDSVSAFGFVDLALNRRPGDPTGRFPEILGHGRRRIGDMLFVPAHTRLQSSWQGGGQRSVCILFGQEERLHRTWKASELDAALDLRDGILRTTMLRLAGELEHPGFDSALMVETLCVQIAVLLRRHFDRAPGSSDPGRKLAAAQLRRVEDMLDGAGPVPSLTELASECGISVRHFCRLFRATTGRSLGDFATARRIERAKHLLASGRIPIKQIAWTCGFATPAAFSAAFRRATGQQPSDFRDQPLD